MTLYRRRKIRDPSSPSICLLQPRRYTSEEIGGKSASEEGQASIETIVSLMVVMSLVFWLFELCMFTYTCSVLNNAAREGVRYAIVHGTDSSICSGPDSKCTDQAPYSKVQAVVTSFASVSLHDRTAMTVSVSYANATASVGNPVAVSVVYTFVPYLNLPGLQNRVTFSSQGQIVY